MHNCDLCRELQPSVITYTGLVDVYDTNEVEVISNFFTVKGIYVSNCWVCGTCLRKAREFTQEIITLEGGK